MSERMRLMMAFILLADAYSHFLPGSSALDLAFACCPGAQDPGSSPSNRRAYRDRRLWICLSCFLCTVALRAVAERQARRSGSQGGQSFRQYQHSAGNVIG